DLPSHQHGPEQVLQIPSFWCYRPGVAGLSAERNRRNGITFGCLNNPSKLNERTIELWMEILKQVPDSRLLLLAWDMHLQTRITDLFGRHGLPASRLEFTPQLPREQYLRRYGQIDIALDPFPYTGHTTSLD